MLKNSGPLTEEHALSIFEMIVEGMVYLGSHGIVHRDLKPANVLLKQSVAKIADFGFCMFDREFSMCKGYSVGSPLYMSP